MAPFVGEGRHRLVVVVVVEQHVGVHVVDRAVHVRARALAGLRVAVHPLLRQAVFEQFEVLLAEGFQRGEGDLRRAFEVEDAGFRLHQGRIDVVIAQVVDAEQAAAQFEIAVEQRQGVVYLGDE
ncbi:MAG: hypothetical protein F4Z20_07200, partial [Gammaproteobacteria bacterium]|nr:hypothetical protein [Gammaproteobacteria bacterium]